MKRIITLMLIISTVGHCEKLIFSNNNEQVDIVGNAQIDFQTGDIVVETNTPHLIIEQPPVILAFYPDDYDIAQGASVDANWTVVNANKCTASGSLGVGNNWSGTVSSTDGDNVVNNISISQFPSTLSLLCQNTLTGSQVSRSFQINEQTTGTTPTATIDSFTVDGSAGTVTVSSPGTATVAWQSSNATSCTASSSGGGVSNWSGALSADGSKQITVSQNATITLTCGTASRSISIFYSDNSGCSSTVFPTGLNRVNATYASINDGQPFGVSTTASALITLNLNQFGTYSGFKIPSGVSNFERRIDLVSPPGGSNEINQATITVSECPGDFTAAAACTRVTGQFDTWRFTTDTGANTNFFCIMDPNKTYYFNVIMSDAPYTNSPSCKTSSSNCSIFYKESN